MAEVGRDFDMPSAGLKRRPKRRLAALRLLVAWIGHESARLDPGYFALVMATGIVSNAFFLHGWRAVSDALFAVAVAAYGWLWMLTLARAARAATALGNDLLNPRRVFLFFTAVAATDVLAVSLGLRGFSAISLALWLVAGALWLALIYLGFGVLMFRNGPHGADVVEGGWLNAIVGTQSLVIVGGAVALPFADAGSQAFIALDMLWSIGLILYAILIVLLCFRFFFSELDPDEVSAPLWVVMGAAAISVNAGAVLAGDGGATPALRALLPFVSGLTLAAWAWATWWIPLLVLLGIWKHGVHRRALDYTPMLWSIVFPLGMYAVASFRLSGMIGAAPLQSWSLVMAWIALAAWCATACGLTVASARTARLLIGLARLF
jgi:tellurite resistance protein TehA-like permease